MSSLPAALLFLFLSSLPVFSEQILISPDFILTQGAQVASPNLLIFTSFPSISLVCCFRVFTDFAAFSLRSIPFGCA
jgi:hypothetical protein